MTTQTLTFSDTIIVYEDYPAGRSGFGKYMKIIGSDVEFNANQVAAYVQNMLGGDFTVNMNFLCPTLGANWTTPAEDGAWWYDSTRPESGEFLGAMIVEIGGLNSVLGRQPITHGSGIGGSILGPLRSGIRTLQFEAIMYATTCRGMEYGKRVIIDGLRGNGCRSNCTLDEIEIWTCCPGENGLGTRDPEPIWRVKKVGLSDGPIEDEPPLPGRTCNVRKIKWAMASESPWLYRVPSTVVSGEFTVNTETCMDVCDWIWDELSVGCATISSLGIGETASIIYVNAGDSPFTGLISVYDVIDSVRADEPRIQYGVYQLPANKTLILDSASYQILLQDNVTGALSSDGGRYIYTVTDGVPFRFISINSSCPDIDICVTTNPGTMDSTASVRIDSIHREL